MKRPEAQRPPEVIWYIESELVPALTDTPFLPDIGTPHERPASSAGTRAPALSALPTSGSTPARSTSEYVSNERPPCVVGRSWRRTRARQQAGVPNRPSAPALGAWDSAGPVAHEPQVFAVPGRWPAPPGGTRSGAAGAARDSPSAGPATGGRRIAGTAAARRRNGANDGPPTRGISGVRKAGSIIGTTSGPTAPGAVSGA